VSWRFWRDEGPRQRAGPPALSPPAATGTQHPPWPRDATVAVDTLARVRSTYFLRSRRVASTQRAALDGGLTISPCLEPQMAPQHRGKPAAIAAASTLKKQRTRAAAAVEPETTAAPWSALCLHGTTRDASLRLPTSVKGQPPPSVT